MVTHFSIRVVIYQGSSSGRHPKGARSIGIGHPRSGDRCTEPRPYTLDPLRVAEQKSSVPSTPPRCRTDCLTGKCDTLAGSRLLAMSGPRVSGATPLDHVAKKRAPTRGASFPTLHNELSGFCATQMRNPRSDTRMLFTLLKENRKFVNKMATHTSHKVPKLCLQ